MNTTYLPTCYLANCLPADPPLPQVNPQDRFGYVLGKEGAIVIEFEANPRPHLEWRVRDQVFKEGGHDNSGRITAEYVSDLVSTICRELLVPTL